MVIGAATMASVTAYCGSPPVPGTLAGRFNTDPVLIGALLLVACAHIGFRRRTKQDVAASVAGWGVAAAAFLSPLCALSVSLFSARIGQHMILLLIAAPLIASALPRWRYGGTSVSLWSATAAFFLALWFWHMPAPYEATFGSGAIYWAMHLTLFGTGIWLWSELLVQRRQNIGAVLMAGTVTSVQMGLLGAIITLASWPMYRPHFATTEAWGMTPLADQQLGGILMWVPGCLIFLWAAVRSLGLLWATLDEAHA